MQVKRNRDKEYLKGEYRMYGIRVYWKRKANTEWFATEEDARSEGMRRDGNVFLLKGNDDGDFNVIEMLKESTFEVGKEYTFRQYGTGVPGIAKLISLDGINAIIDVLESDDWKLKGIQRGKLTGGSIIVKRGLMLCAHCPL